MNENNDMKIKKLLESESVPEELSPENIKKMLDEKAPVKKRKKITHIAARVTAAAAACALICGFSVYYAEQRNSFNNKVDNSKMSSMTSVETSENSVINSSPEQTAVMNSISDYGQLYQMLEKSSEKYLENYDNCVDVDCETGMGGAESTNDKYYETYNQEDGVLEADIAKTDGKYIYYLCNKYIESESAYKPYINIAEADNGSFANYNAVDISADFPKEEKEKCDTNVIVYDMYLYNDMLIVMSEVQVFDYSDNEVDSDGFICGIVDSEYTTYVNVYTTGIEPQLICSYAQDGVYNDVRITPEGYMYLITNDYSEDFSNIVGEDDVSSYIPSYTIDGASCLIPPEHIMLPNNDFGDCYSIDYLVIGSLDLNTPGSISETDIKAIAGYSGSIYCSGSNLYTATSSEKTVINRIALDNGIITPAASGMVEGYIKDQFSMSEYDGLFRIATTIVVWEDVYSNVSEDSDIVTHTFSHIENCVYVLDLDMNVVGQIGGLGIGETIKSVSFSGDIAYVVTYELTDPLFSIDLSNPKQPVLLDEYKILGYSTYMQQWSDGLLLGFGANADENANEDGVKLVMFDNSDPNELNEVGIYAINGDEDMQYFSEAVWERKALLIAPEKNLIGVPVTVDSYTEYDGWSWSNKYMFFSYEDGQFILKGEINGISDRYDNYGNFRAIYIGDYVYTLSASCFISADTASVTMCDSIEF